MNKLLSITSIHQHTFIVLFTAKQPSASSAGFMYPSIPTESKVFQEKGRLHLARLHLAQFPNVDKTYRRFSLKAFCQNCWFMQRKNRIKYNLLKRNPKIKIKR